ncbi:MAG: HD domain-containing phosphohydrolase [Phycisphaeraceae bacterium]
MTQRLDEQLQLTEADLGTRCRALGVTLVDVSPEGRITASHLRGSGPLERTVVHSGLFTQALREQASRWNDVDDPQPAAPFSGCWLLPLPVMKRRRRAGYQVGVVITADLAESEPFQAWCALAELDAQAVTTQLRRDAALGRAEVDRLAATMRWIAGDLQQIGRQRDEIGHLSQQLGESYEELSMVYQLSARMTVTQEVEAFLSSAVRELQQVVGLRWIGMYLTDDDRRLQSLRGQAILAGHSDCDREALTAIGHTLLQQFGESDAAVIGDAAELGIQELLPIARRLLIVPIAREGKPLAVLFGADKVGGADLCSVDSKLVTSAAQSMGIFLENAMLYEDVQDMFMGTLHALIATIDAKDTYTCGHSERVAMLSRDLAQAAGLPATIVERVHLSGLIHDVGKIGVPEAVLCKPGRLTRSEFAMIKAHPEIGVRILSDIHQMHDLLPGVLHHHERWDGKGYPHHLAGEDIPLFGRIICLADSFDAMSTDRTYRKAMPLTDAMAEIKACAGAHFDPDLARVFTTLNFEPYHERVAEHQRRESPLDQAMRRVT